MPMLNELLQRGPLLLVRLDLREDPLPVLGQGRATSTRVHDQLTMAVNDSSERNTSSPREPSSILLLALQRYWRPDLPLVLLVILKD
eukprot:8670638-Lingulodinium_polyedra.AAC.1